MMHEPQTTEIALDGAELVVEDYRLKKVGK